MGLNLVVGWLFSGMLVLPILVVAEQMTDDAGKEIHLDRPAQRIVSLAPHATEILFAIGAGEKIVGAVNYSDYPPAAQSIPRVGGYNNIDVERIVALRPDLVVAWSSGNNPAQVEALERLGIRVFRNEPRRVLDVAATARRLGKLVGTAAQAQHFAGVFEARYRRLRETYADRRPVRLFYEIWNQPLLTINGQHLISDVIRLCGAVNVFADLPALVPQVDVEAVLAARPEIIVAGSGMGQDRQAWLDAWRRWPSLPAVVRNQLYLIDADLLQRHGPRILDGAEALCAVVDAARQAADTEPGRGKSGTRPADGYHRVYMAEGAW